MTAEMLLTLGVAAGALALFVWNRVRADVVGLIVMAALMVLGLVTTEEALSGFANEATATVALMLVLSAGLLHTGAVDAVARWMGRLARGSELRLLVVMVGLVVPVSAFINNTAAVAILLPVVLGLARERGIAPSRLLMPLSFGSQLGGTLTLIGTSTNLLVAGLVLDLGLPRIGLFDITPPALLLVAIGVTYLLTVGRWLAPTRETGADLASSYELRDYLTGLIVEPESPLAGRTLAETRFGQTHGLQVVEIQRGDGRIRFPGGGTLIRAGDLLLVKGKIADIAQIEEINHLTIAGTTPELDVSDAEQTVRLAEMIVPPRSPVVGRTIQEIAFRARFGVTALGIQRHGQTLHEHIGRVPLEGGDMLLVQGANRTLERLHWEGDLALLGAVRLPAKRRRKTPIAVAIMVGVILLPTLEIAPIVVSALLGAIAMFLSGCITPGEAYEEVDWMTLVLLGAILPLGIAMQKSGAAEWLASGILEFTAAWGPRGTLGALYLLTALLTALISNNATAALLTPVAVAMATEFGVSPWPLVIGVMFAASNDFSTPIGYQTNTFIYGPGGYRFTDYLRVGGPLNLLLLLAAPFIIPLFFPF